MNSKWNRCYRLIWSESSHEWVVADELSSAGGKGKSRGLVSSILCAALVAGGILAGGSAPALADSCPTTNTTISGTVTTKCIVTATDKVTVTSTGTIKKGTVFTYTILVDASGTGVTIDNSGKILHTLLPAIMVKTNARGTKITNQTGGLISVATSSAIWFSTNSFDAGSVLTNNGTIKVNGTATSFATGIGIAGPLAGTLSNTDTISALAQTKSNTPKAFGIQVGGDISGTLNNSGTISATAIEDHFNSKPAIARGIDAGSLSGSLTVTRI